MIILDTNIFSVLMQTQPDQRIIDWLDAIDPQLLWTTSITIFEIKYGIELMASGKKKAQLLHAFETMLREEFRSRIVEFELNAALASGELAASLKRTGYNTDCRDVQIAGIALFHGATLATRNVKDFDTHSIEIINPYASS